MSHQNDIKQLIATQSRRLQKLKEQKALQGIDTPPHILLEIENIEAEIEQLQSKLKEQGNVTEMVSNDTNINSRKDTIWIPQVWWVPIVVALIGLIGVLIPLVINNKTPTSQPFIYSVRVQKEGASLNVPNARVTIEVPGQAPLDEITDSNGFARISINVVYIGKPGRLLVEANGYEDYRQEIDLTDGNLPDTIPLKQLP